MSDLISRQRARASAAHRKLLAAGISERDLELAGQWVRAALFGNEKSISFCINAGVPPERMKMQGEGINAQGGFLVPEEIEASIISLRDVAGVVRQYGNVVTMGSDQRHWPRRVGGITASFTSEAAAAQETQLTFDEITLSARKLTGFVRLSNELVEDESAMLGAWLISELSWSFAAKEDQISFMGTGIAADGGCRGICTLLVDGKHDASKIAAAAQHSSLDKIDAADLGALMGLLPSYAWPNARWFTSGYGVGAGLARLAATTGGNIGVAPDNLAYAGFPISIVPAMPGSGSQSNNVIVAFGDLSLAVALGNRRGVTVRQSQHRYLEYDQTAIKGTERVDVVAANLGDNTTAGAIVGLTAA